MLLHATPDTEPDFVRLATLSLNLTVSEVREAIDRTRDAYKIIRRLWDDKGLLESAGLEGTPAYDRICDQLSDMTDKGRRKLVGTDDYMNHIVIGSKRLSYDGLYLLWDFNREFDYAAHHEKYSRYTSHAARV
jgi:hypothetical protein